MREIMRFTPVFLISSILSSCSGLPEPYDSTWQNRYGPNVVMQYNAVSRHLESQQKIMNAFFKAAHSSQYKYAEYLYISEICSEKHADPEAAKECQENLEKSTPQWTTPQKIEIANKMALESRTEWYPVVLTGFNFVDEQCDQYMKALFVIDAASARAVGSINATGQVTNAILSAASASSVSMTIVAQVFGLASSLTTLNTSAYLLGAGSSGPIYNLVKRQQQVLRGYAKQNKGEINNSATAYGYIRNYLQLCLPQGIKASMNAAIESADVQTLAVGTTKTETKKEEVNPIRPQDSPAQAISMPSRGVGVSVQ